MKEDIVAIKDLQGYLTPANIDRLISCANNRRDKLLLKILRSSGRRVTEVIGRKKPLQISYTYKSVTKNPIYDGFKGLTPQDIDYEKRMIKFRIIKKKRETYKLKTIDDDTFNELISYIKEKKLELDDELFPITRQRVFQIVRECAKRAMINLVGIKKPHPHHLRHSFAVNILEKSDDPSAIKKIQQALEHSNLNVTSVYLQFKQEDIRELQNKAFKKTKVQPIINEEPILNIPKPIIKKRTRLNRRRRRK